MARAGSGETQSGATSGLTPFAACFQLFVHKQLLGCDDGCVQPWRRVGCAFLQRSCKSQRQGRESPRLVCACSDECECVL